MYAPCQDSCRHGLHVKNPVQGGGGRRLLFENLVDLSRLLRSELDGVIVNSLFADFTAHYP